MRWIRNIARCCAALYNRRFVIIINKLRLPDLQARFSRARSLSNVIRFNSLDRGEGSIRIRKMNETEGRRIFFDKWRRVREDERNTSFDEFSPFVVRVFTHIRLPQLVHLRIREERRNLHSLGVISMMIKFSLPIPWEKELKLTKRGRMQRITIRREFFFSGNCSIQSNYIMSVINLPLYPWIDRMIPRYEYYFLYEI